MSRDLESDCESENTRYYRGKRERKTSRKRSESNDSRRRSRSSSRKRLNHRRSSSVDGQSKQRSRPDSFSRKQDSSRNDSKNRSASPRRRSVIVFPQNKQPSTDDRRSLTPGRQAGYRFSSSRKGETDPHSRQNHRSPIKGSPSKCLGVFNLNYDTSRGFIERTFSKFGYVEKVDLVCDPCGYSRGFGFVTFERQEDADEAIKKMDNTTFDGNAIRVDYSISRGPHPKTPGGYMGRKSSAYIREGRGGVGARRNFGERSKEHWDDRDRDRRNNHMLSQQKRDDRYGQSYQQDHRSNNRNRSRSRSPIENYRKDRRYNLESSSHYDNSSRRY